MPLKQSLPDFLWGWCTISVALEGWQKAKGCLNLGVFLRKWVPQQPYNLNSPRPYTFDISGYVIPVSIQFHVPCSCAVLGGDIPKSYTLNRVGMWQVV